MQYDYIKSLNRNTNLRIFSKNLLDDDFFRTFRNGMKNYFQLGILYLKILLLAFLLCNPIK